MSEYKAKEIEIPGIEGRYVSHKVIHEMLPSLLPEHDEPGWEVCGVLAAPFYTTNKVIIGVLYRKIET